MRKFDVVIFSLTIVLAVFAALLLFLCRPASGISIFPAEVKIVIEEHPVSSSLSDGKDAEAVIAEKENAGEIAGRVAAELLENGSFMRAVEEKTAEYLDSKLDSIEKRLAALADEKISAAVSSLRAGLLSTEEIIDSLLGNERFMTAVENIAAEKIKEYKTEVLVSSVVSSETFRSVVEGITDEHIRETPAPSSSSSVPSIPEPETESDIDAYREARDRRRSGEFARVLEYLEN